ncbi:MAG: hypothetical protein V1886_03135 [archaeon]
MISKNKTRAQVNFQFIFAMIVGAVILFLAIFATARYVNTQRYQYDTELAAKLSILLNPVESSIASSIATKIDFPVRTRLQLSCVYSGIGREDMKIATMSTLGEKWQEYGATQNIYNKYIFSSFQEGKTLFIFSKSFEMPFKIADLIYAVMQDYCFVNPPDDVLYELKELNMSKIYPVYKVSECRKSSKTVCFQNSDCNVNVFGQCYSSCNSIYDYGIVENRQNPDTELVYYTGLPLMYAAVFSDADLYKCNVKRLMYRLSLVSKLYAEKAKLLDARGCGTGTLRDKLNSLSIQALSIAKTDNIQLIADISKQVENVNNGMVCSVF